ncbi:MAG: substrate-binding domain-containing protein [Ignavibacteriae bacterium]|nr:substrate-binding domain-containing protein [Ignavibacteria bacterium]MBI3365878.1 substrate-binding domain-containing protein [Ignavibacteriota bacterium]
MINVLSHRWLIISIVLLIGCQEERKETATKGRVTIITSESVAPLMQEEKAKFEELYPQAHVGLTVATAREAITQFFNVETVKVIVSSRPLNQEERDAAKKFNLTFGEYKTAIDAIAIVANLENPVAQLRTTQLDSIFNGSITHWEEIEGEKHLAGAIELCLPSRNSGTYEVVASTILKGKEFAKAATIVNSSPEMITFVTNHSRAFGMLSLNWLNQNQNKDKMKVIELADPNAPDSLGTRGKYFSPHQAYVYERYYPLTREIFIYSRADVYNVGAGFLTFVTSAPGQKIVLNQGLVPATMPVRLVQLTNRGQ